MSFVLQLGSSQIDVGECEAMALLLDSYGAGAYAAYKVMMRDKKGSFPVRDGILTFIEKGVDKNEKIPHPLK